MINNRFGLIENDGKWHIEYRGRPCCENESRCLKLFATKDDAWNYYKTHKKEVTRK